MAALVTASARAYGASMGNKIDISENLRAVHAAIKAAPKEFLLPDEAAAATQVIAVSKTFDAENIMPALQAGHRVFGENRVQEAAQKWPALKQQFPDTSLHLIGPLQTNKVKDALKLFDVIHTLDREKLALEFVKQRDEKKAILPPMFIQVNSGAEPQKAGVLPAELGEFVGFARKKCKLPVCGLMCIPPAGEPPAPYFLQLKEASLQYNLPELSMGMSADYALAAAMGATYVRVGSAIFGPRSNSPKGTAS